ncbi:hypothetical protein [Suttonella ornithocola]|uniref:Uncharacterized protein n=1 Tax=Suttonella ornithocola TaxID=279832 RepID=A0A380MS47_9GAMM|nr:hypothetical protein [Suttonella ornithocola]SUO94866.1 Uncharacterised protein [Suttonella ornithocola]
MKKILTVILIIGLLQGYVFYLGYLKEKELLKLATSFEKLCVDNGFCPSQPVGWSCYADNYCYDKNSQYSEIIYKTKNLQQHFELTWKIATGMTLVATGGVKEKIVVRKQFD